MSSGWLAVRILQPAEIHNLIGGTLVVPAQVKVYPGRGAVEFPHARGHTACVHFTLSACCRQAIVGPVPDAVFVRVYFAHPAPAAPAGTVAGMLGAARFRAEKPHVLDPAIPAVLAVQEDIFGRVFHQAGEKCGAFAGVQKTADLLVQGGLGRLEVKEGSVGFFKEIIMQFFPE